MTSTTLTSTSIQPLNAAASTGIGRRRTRRAAALLAGLASIFAITTATDLALHAAGIYPDPGVVMGQDLFLLAAAYRIVYGVLGCYVTARLAHERPMAHALVLGLVGTAISVAGAIAMWDAGPAWYSLAVIAMSLPCAWLGGKLRLVQLARRSGLPEPVVTG